MIEAAMIWNEPNNKSHWDFEIDPGLGAVRARWRGWRAQAIAAEAPRSAARARRHLADRPGFHPLTCAAQGVLDELDVVAVHGFPLDWNHWPIDEWPEKLEEIRAVTDLPVWVSEVGVSTLRRRGGAGIGACGAPPSC